MLYNVCSEVQKYVLGKKFQLMLNIFCGGLQTQNFEFLFSRTIFYLVLSFSISHMYGLDYIILQQADTRFHKLSENIYFYQVIFHRFCFIIYFLLGQLIIQSLKNNLRAEMQINHNLSDFSSDDESEEEQLSGLIFIQINFENVFFEG